MSDKKCIAPDCDKNAERWTMYCNKHYKQVSRHGRLTSERERNRYSNTDKCISPGCNNKPEKQWLCEKHYAQYKKHGKTFLVTTKDKNVIIKHDDRAEIVLLDNSNIEKARAIIDLTDVHLVETEHWCLDNDGYARKSNYPRTGLHRFLLNPPVNMDVDHINRNPLDNRRSNLRICTRSQNNINSKIRSNNSSGYTGVSYHVKYGKWEARIWKNKEKIHLGFFDHKNDAIIARQKAESVYYGEFVPTDRRRQTTAAEIG